MGKIPHLVFTNLSAAPGLFFAFANLKSGEKDRSNLADGWRESLLQVPGLAGKSLHQLCQGNRAAHP